MTEYDYSPEAYERYLATQRRIANWVDQTENYRPEFANALSPPAGYIPGHDSHTRTKQSPRRLRRHHRSRSPSVDSSSSESYGYGPNDPGPMPIRSAPGHLGMFPQQQMPFQHMPMVSPPLVSPQAYQMPSGYYGAPTPHKAHRRSHSHSHHSPPAIFLGSPPVSPGLYGYPGGPQGYVMMPQQRGRHMPVMSPPLQPNSAPVQVSSFNAPAAPPQSTSYFQLQPHQVTPQSFGSFPDPTAPTGLRAVFSPQPWSSSSAVVSPSHSVYTTPGGITVVSPQQSSYQPMYPQLAISPATTLTSPHQYVYPTSSLHQRVYDLTGQNKHTLRRSIG